MPILRTAGAAAPSIPDIRGYGSPLSRGPRKWESLRPHRRQSRHRGKPGLAGIAAHDGFALRIAQHVLDIVKTVGRELLDRVDDAFRAAAPVRAHDLRRHRQALLLVGHQSLSRMFGARQRVRKTTRIENGLRRAIRSHWIHRGGGIPTRRTTTL